MKLLPMLTAGAALAPDNFNGYPRPNPIEVLFWALFGVAMAILIVRTTMRLRKRLPGTDPVNSATLSMPDPKAVRKLKLAQLLFSVVVLITATALGLLVRWFDLLRSTDSENGEPYLAEALYFGLQFFVFSFVPVLVWHLADLIEQPRAKSRLVAALTSHALLTGVIVANGLLWLLSETGWFTDIGPCGGIFLLLTEACWYTHPAIEAPTLLLFLAPLPITLVKLAVALWSRLGPRS